MDGRLRSKCGSLAKMGWPEYDLFPETAQLLLPLCGLGLAMVPEIDMVAEAISYSGASGIFKSIKLQSVSLGMIGSLKS